MNDLSDSTDGQSLRTVSIAVPGEDAAAISAAGAAGARKSRGDHAMSRLVCVTGAKGSPGATTLAAALASSVPTDTGRVLLIDADPDGGNLAAVFGAGTNPGMVTLAAATGTGSRPTSSNGTPNRSARRSRSWPPRPAPTRPHRP